MEMLDDRHVHDVTLLEGVHVAFTGGTSCRHSRYEEWGADIAQA